MERMVREGLKGFVSLAPLLQEKRKLPVFVCSGRHMNPDLHFHGKFNSKEDRQIDGDK
jgi:hypothetical protein